MEKISDFFKDLKERLSSPLFSSFIITWLIINWKIPIVLFFYKISDLIVDGYKSYLDFIIKNLKTENYLWYPLLAAILYTFLYPFIRNSVIAFNSWIKSWGETWSLSVAKDRKISLLKYIQLRDIYQDRTKILEDVLAKESGYLKENEQIKNQVLQLQNQNNDIQNELQKWRDSRMMEQLNGEWEIFYPNSGTQAVYRVRIENGVIKYLDNPPPDKNSETGIRTFFRSLHNRQIIFTTAFNAPNNKKIYNYFVLDIVDNMNILRGYEDESIPIEFRRTR